VYSSDSHRKGALLIAKPVISADTGAAGNMTLLSLQESNGLTDSQTVNNHVLDQPRTFPILKTKMYSSNSITLAWTSSVGVSCSS
jgi:hypothetical protein